MTVTYDDFLREKVNFCNTYGSAVSDSAIHPKLKLFQRKLTQWAVLGGRRAIFANFGLGKTILQLETVRLTLAHHRAGKGIIVLPLGVRQEFKRDAAMLDIDVRFIRTPGEMDGDGIYLTNYESIRDGKLDPALFTVASLDEASVLRSFGSKTYQTFLSLFAPVPYRFVATATPSPNRYKELIHYAAFLGIMDSGQALTRWFQRDSTKANNLTLYPHKRREFFLWLNTWAVFVQRPSDICGHVHGCNCDDGYELPPLEVTYHEVEVDHARIVADRDGQAPLFRGGALGVTQAAREKRDTMPARITRLASIVNHAPKDHFILWHHLEDERREIKRMLPEATEVYGALDLDVREQRVTDFSDGHTRLLATKPELSGSGCNFQRHCHRAIFAGVNFNFNDLYQAIHRLYRYLQAKTVQIHIIYAESEREVVREFQRKWVEHEELRATMTDIIRQFGLSSTGVTDTLSRSIGIERIQESGQGWVVANNDCVHETRTMEDSSVKLIISSIPFATHYEYTPSYNDFGHTDNNAHFWEQMDYLTPELFRVLEPGRIAAIHVKDRILFGSVTGYGFPSSDSFHEEASLHFQKHGFVKIGMITIVTDVVRENNQTYRLGWSEQCKDGTKMGVGCPEYVLLLRKPQTDRTRGYADIPVTKDKTDYTRARWQADAHAFWRSNGDRHLTPEELAQLPADQMSRLFTEQTLRQIYDHEAHVQLGENLEDRGTLPATFMSLAPGSHHPEVWHDINRMETLNTEQSRRAQAMHVCLARGALVLTRGGYRPIQELVVGEYVLTHKGRWRPVLAVAQTGVRPVVQVRAHGVHLTLTPDHKVWTRYVNRRSPAAADRARTVEPGWVPAADIVGSYINRKLPPVEPSAVSSTVWWVIGRWLADGHIDARGCAVISCGKHEVHSLTAQLGEFASNPFRDTGTAMQVQLRDPGRLLRNILKSCGTGAAGKHLPPEAYTLPAEHAKALLDGYLSGDGYFLPDRNRWMASSVSRELLLGMTFLAQRAYGAIASVYAGRPARRGQIQGREVNMRADWAFSFDLPSPDRRKRPLMLDDGAWMKVRSAESVGLAETWNLRVKEDESYTAEGCVVKNCPLQFMTVDRLLTRYSNPGELVYDPFGGLFTVPLRAIKLGRLGRAVELNPDYFRDGVAYLRAEERRIHMPSLFDLDEATS